MKRRIIITASNSVREHRIAQGLTKGELAKLTGCSIEALTYIEDQRLMPSGKNIKKLCKALNMSKEDLFKVHKQLIEPEHKPEPRPIPNPDKPEPKKGQYFSQF